MPINDLTMQFASQPGLLTTAVQNRLKNRLARAQIKGAELQNQGAEQTLQQNQQFNEALAAANDPIQAANTLMQIDPERTSKLLQAKQTADESRRAEMQDMARQKLSQIAPYVARGPEAFQQSPMAQQGITYDQAMQHYMEAAVLAGDFDPADIQGVGGPSEQKPFAPVEYIDENEQRRIAIPTIDPATGETRFRDVPLKEGAKLVAGRKTPEEIAEGTRERESQKQSQELASKAFEQIPAIAKNVRNIDAAIKAIDEGARTGAVERFFPSIRAASVELENLRNQMGLDIIGATTFGNLSEGEMSFALDTALPTGLNEQELRDWLVRKRKAQKKMIAGLREKARFFSSGGTIEELIEQEDQASNEGMDNAQGNKPPSEMTDEELLNAL